MKMMTKEIESKIPALYAQDGKGDEAIVHVKYFCPWSHWTWYATEFDPKQRMFFGWVYGDSSEMGYFNLDELESLSGPFGLKIERDLYFKPMPLSEVKKGKGE